MSSSATRPGSGPTTAPASTRSATNGRTAPTRRWPSSSGELLAGVITQNIDRLHRAAGSENVVEVHGSIETSSCTRCGASYGIDEVDALFNADGVAECGACGGAVKPGVVLFGELLPESAMARPRAGRARDLMLCVGSSLVVHPVAGLPAVTLAGGGQLAIVTKGATPYDGDAVLKLEGEVDEELSALLGALPQASPALRT